MNKYGTQLWKYKFNYGVKAFGAFLVINSYQTFQTANEESFLTDKQKAEYAANTTLYAAGLTGLCMVIWEVNL